MQHAICNLTAQDKQKNKINNVFSNYVVQLNNYMNFK